MTEKRIIIAVTGTPATGKSTFAIKIANSLPGSKIIELNDIVDRFKLFSGVDEFGSRIVKIKELEEKTKEMIKAAKGNLIIVGHLVPELKLHYDVVVVLRISLRELITRLNARHYEKEKIKENIVSESVNYCGVKSRERCRETYEVKSEEQMKEILSYISDAVKGNAHEKPSTEEISSLNELLELIGEGNEYGF